MRIKFIDNDIIVSEEMANLIEDAMHPNCGNVFTVVSNFDFFQLLFELEMGAN